MAEVVRAMAEPLAKVDKITIISTGDEAGGGMGASRVTGEVTKIAAQVPALLESLTGMKMSDLMGQIKPMEPRPETKSETEAQLTRPLAYPDAGAPPSAPSTSCRRWAGNGTHPVLTTSHSPHRPEETKSP